MAVTIKEVAKLANVSISTVSKVITGNYNISESTSRRIREAMRELNYYPNLRARNFAQKTTHNIFFVTHIDRGDSFKYPHMFEIVSGAQKALSEKGYTLTLVSIDPQDDAELIDKIVSQQNADGLIMHSSVITKKYARRIAELNFPHIVIGRPDFTNQLCWIDVNNRLAGEIAANHLCGVGYRKFAYIGGVETDRISRQRYEGVKSVLSQNGIVIGGDFVKAGEPTKEFGKKLMDEILTQPQAPEAVICSNNYYALGAVSAIHGKGLRIPEDIAVISFDSYPYSEIIEPPLTVVDIDVYDLGIQSGKLLLDKIANPNLMIQFYTISPTLIIRESTGGTGEKQA